MQVLFLDYIKEEIGGGHFVLARLANYFQKNPELKIAPIVFLNNYNGFTEKFIDEKVTICEYKIPDKILNLDRNITVFKAIINSWSLLIFWFRFSKMLLNYCRKNGIEIIHVNSMRFFILASLAIKFLKRTKVVFHLHDALISSEKGGNMSRFASWLVILCIKYCANKTIAVSEFVKNTVLEKDNSKKLAHKVHVVHNGVELSTLNKSKSKIDPQRIKKYIKLLSFGVLSERKGFNLGIMAVSHLKQKYSLNVEYKILGDGYFKSYLIDLAKSLNLHKEVKFLGFKENVSYYIKQADIILIPSVWQDPLPLTVIESMENQKVVIATRVGGIPEMIENGKTGFLVNLDNAPQEIAKKVVELIEHPQVVEEIANNAAKRVREYFNIERMAGEIAQIYLAALK